MTSDTDERLEEMASRLDRVERANRVMKILGAVAFAAMIPVASVVAAKIPTKTVSREFDLVSSTGQTTAALVSLSGKPNLLFFDRNGKTVVGVGIDPNGIGAGIAVLDGNTLLPGTGTARNAWGVTTSGPQAGIGDTTFDRNGTERTRWGDAIDDSLSGYFLFDATGGLRTGVEYDPAVNFNGFFGQDGSGHNLSLLGNATDNTASFMQLFDSSGVQRVRGVQSGAFEALTVYNTAGTQVGQLP